MARLFNGSSDYAQSSATLDLTAYNQISLAFWLWWDSYADNDNVALELGTAYFNVEGGFLVDPNGSDRSKFMVALKGNVGISAFDFTRPSAAAWHQYVCCLDMSKSSGEIDAVYVDGVSQTLASLVDSNNTGNFGDFTLNFMARNATSKFGAGRLAEVAVWCGAILSASEAAALGAGISPLLVRAASLDFYWPLHGRTGPESEWMQGNGATVNAPSFTDHPLVRYPAGPQLGGVAGEAPEPPTGQPMMRRWGGVPGMVGAGRIGRSW